jgi:NAD-dependent dihydropyrimidine dehydrogenase PreA subunit
MGIQVHKIVKLADSGATGGWEEYHPENCIGCNACTYTCRAGKNVKMIMAKVNGKI